MARSSVVIAVRLHQALAERLDALIPKLQRAANARDAADPLAPARWSSPVTRSDAARLALLRGLAQLEEDP